MSTKLHPIFSFWHIEGDRHADGPIATVIPGSGTSTARPCPGCQRVLEEAPFEGASFRALDMAVRVWPDVLNSYGLIIGDRVLSDLNEIGARGFVAHKLGIGEVESTYLQEMPHPDYSLMELTGRVDVDRQWYDEGQGDLCPQCHGWTPGASGKSRWDRMHLPVMETWDGTDLLTYGNVRTGYHLCTTRIIELARAKKWTGVAFRLMTPRPYFVDLRLDDWLAKAEAWARAEYPRLFTNQL